MARKAVAPKANGGETVKSGKVGKKNPSRNAKKKEDSPVDRFSQDDTSEKEDTSAETVEASKSAASTKNSKSSKSEKKPVGRAGKHDSKTAEDEDAPDVVEPSTERNGVLRRDGINVSKTHKEVLPSIAAVINDLIENKPNTPLDIIAFMNMVTGKLNQQFPVGTEF